MAGRRWEVRVPRQGGRARGEAPAVPTEPGGSRCRCRSHPRGAGRPGEGHSLPGRQSERCLPWARANQRPANSHLNPVPGSRRRRGVTAGGRVMASRANQRPRIDDWQEVKPMRLPRVTRRLPAERLAAGTPRGQSGPPGAGAPVRGAATAMAGGARGGAGMSGAGPGRGGTGRAGPVRRGASPRRGSSSWEVRGAGAGGTPPPRGVRSSPGRGWAAAARPAASSPLNMAQAAAAGR